MLLDLLAPLATASSSSSSSSSSTKIWYCATTLPSLLSLLSSNHGRPIGISSWFAQATQTAIVCAPVSVSCVKGFVCVCTEMLTTTTKLRGLHTAMCGIWEARVCSYIQQLALCRRKAAWINWFSEWMRFLKSNERRTTWIVLSIPPFAISWFHIMYASMVCITECMFSLFCLLKPICSLCQWYNRVWSTYDNSRFNLNSFTNY